MTKALSYQLRWGQRRNFGARDVRQRLRVDPVVGPPGIPRARPPEGDSTRAAPRQTETPIGAFFSSPQCTHRNPQ
jgi:hypothetical protein